jgi:hypothetical protein
VQPKEQMPKLPKQAKGDEMNCCDEYGKCTQGHGCPAHTIKSDVDSLEPIIKPEQSLWLNMGDPVQSRRERMREEYAAGLDDGADEEREDPQYED